MTGSKLDVRHNMRVSQMVCDLKLECNACI